MAGERRKRMSLSKAVKAEPGTKVIRAVRPNGCSVACGILAHVKVRPLSSLRYRPLAPEAIQPDPNADLPHFLYQL